MSFNRSRWAAVGAAVAITLGAGGIASVRAAVSSGERTVFVPITPCRIFDTRPDTQVGPRSAPLGPNDTYTIAGRGIVGDCNISADAAGLVLNLTAVGATQLTFLTVYPADAPTRPESSSLNPAAGAPPTPNAVSTDLSATGEFNIYNAYGSVHILADVVGYYEDHNHDDRYYTKAEIDTRVGSGPQTMTVWEDAFTSDRSVDHMLRGYVNTSDGFTFIDAGGSNEASAPVDLPNGAQVTGVVAHYYDNNAAADYYLNMTFECRQIPAGAATAPGSFDSGLRLLYASSDSASPNFRTKALTGFGGATLPLTIDNSTCAYAVHVSSQNDIWTTTGPTVTHLKFLGVVITYAMPG